MAPVAGEFAPDLILVSAGFDAHLEDPLAGLALTSEDFGQMAVEVRELGRRLGAPVGAVLEGGYAAERAGRLGRGDDARARRRRRSRSPAPETRGRRGGRRAGRAALAGGRVLSAGVVTGSCP